MKIDVITLFPEMFKDIFDLSIIGRAKEKGIFEVLVHNLRDFTDTKHKIVDDYPFGGGPGMVLKIEPLWKAIELLKNDSTSKKMKVILTSPSGKLLNHRLAMELTGLEHMILICGHYEGVDERVREYLIDEEISIGDYILTGGELPAMVIIETVIRLLDGVLTEGSVKNDSFYSSLLTYPQYTRPNIFENYKVPEILLSGNHEAIKKWRRKKALERTFLYRPELLNNIELSKEDLAIVKSLKENLYLDNNKHLGGATPDVDGLLRKHYECN